MSSYQKKIITLLKLVLIAATSVFVFYKLFHAYKIDDLIAQTNLELTFSMVLIILVVFVLMFSNWLIETYKWKILVQKNESFTFYEAFKAVTAGVALNIITPNQLGDFIGRVIYLKKTDKIKGTLVTVIGHTAQVIMTVTFGAIGIISILSYKQYIHGHLIFASGLLIVSLVPIAIFAFLNMRVISGLRLNKSVSKYLAVFRKYNNNELVMLLILSFMRYSVFVLQYYLLSIAFNVNISPVQTIVCISATLFVQSFVPSFILVELGMRGASALLIFGFYTQETIPVLLTTYLIWIINILIPGIAGMVYLLKWRSKTAE